MFSFKNLNSGFPTPLLLLLVLFLHCAPEVPGGEFAWASSNDQDLEELEKALLIEQNYRVSRTQLYFYDHETIWCVYHMESGNYNRNGEYTIALFEKNNTPNPVEIELREARLEIDQKRAFLRQKYGPLKPGTYLLKVALNSNVFDEIQFHIIPPDGPAAAREWKDNEEEKDEIVRYSS